MLNNNNLQTNTSSALHNVIMEAGGKDRPLMLAPVLRMNHTKNQYIGTHAIIGFDGAPPTRASRVMETYATVSKENRKKIDAEDKVVQIILTRIDNDIYSTVNACPNAMEMWKVIERLKQGTQVVQQTEIQCFNYKEFRHLVRACKKAKRDRDSSYHKEKMLLYTANNPGPIFDIEPLEQVHTNVNYNVFANKRQHIKKPKSINDTYVIEKDDINITLDSSDMCNDEGEIDQNTTEEEERALLASLIANLKLEIHENKKINKDLKKANMSLNSELMRYKESNYVK
ncbi:hypothetical protein Tco_0847315 [Tanacetum coccineum]